MLIKFYYILICTDSDYELMCRVGWGGKMLQYLLCCKYLEGK